jgi:hypothetical protein
MRWHLSRFMTGECEQRNVMGWHLSRFMTGECEQRNVSTGAGQQGESAACIGCGEGVWLRHLLLMKFTGAQR